MNGSPTPRATGCTLAQYAAVKQLPEGFLKVCGLTDLPNYNGAPAVRIPYYATDHSELTVQFRLHPTGAAGEPRFTWKVGTHPHPYGLDRLDDAKAAGYVVLVEGPSDAQTLWYHSYPALGLPSDCWKDKWADDLEGIQTIYVVDAQCGSVPSRPRSRSVGDCLQRAARSHHRPFAVISINTRCNAFDPGRLLPTHPLQGSPATAVRRDHAR
jgi:hypothetical protein